MTILEIYSKLTNSDGYDNFISSLKYLENGIKLSNILKEIQDSNIDFEIVEGYKSKLLFNDNIYDDFTKCKIYCTNESIYNILKKEFIYKNKENEIIIGI